MPLSKDYPNLYRLLATGARAHTYHHCPPGEPDFARIATAKPGFKRLGYGGEEVELPCNPVVLDSYFFGDQLSRSEFSETYHVHVQALLNILRANTVPIYWASKEGDLVADEDMVAKKAAERPQKMMDIEKAGEQLEGCDIYAGHCTGLQQLLEATGSIEKVQLCQYDLDKVPVEERTQVFDYTMLKDIRLECNVTNKQEADMLLSEVSERYIDGVRGSLDVSNIPPEQQFKAIHDVSQQGKALPTRSSFKKGVSYHGALKVGAMEQAGFKRLQSRWPYNHTISAAIKQGKRILRGWTGTLILAELPSVDTLLGWYHAVPGQRSNLKKIIFDCDLSKLELQDLDWLCFEHWWGKQLVFASKADGCESIQGELIRLLAPKEVIFNSGCAALKTPCTSIKSVTIGDAMAANKILTLKQSMPSLQHIRVFHLYFPEASACLSEGLSKLPPDFKIQADRIQLDEPGNIDTMLEAMHNGRFQSFEQIILEVWEQSTLDHLINKFPSLTRLESRVDIVERSQLSYLAKLPNLEYVRLFARAEDETEERSWVSSSLPSLKVALITNLSGRGGISAAGYLLKHAPYLRIIQVMDTNRLDLVQSFNGMTLVRKRLASSTLAVTTQARQTLATLPEGLSDLEFGRSALEIIQKENALEAFQLQAPKKGARQAGEAYGSKKVRIGRGKAPYALSEIQHLRPLGQAKLRSHRMCRKEVFQILTKLGDQEYQVNVGESRWQAVPEVPISTGVEAFSLARYQKRTDCYQGCITLDGPGDIALPGWTARDRLAEILVNGQDAQQSQSKDFRVFFNQDACQWVVRTTKAVSVNIDYVIQHMPAPALPEALERWRQAFVASCSEDEPCRLRAARFMMQGQQMIPEAKFRYVVSDVHAWVEMELGGQVYEFDLGGTVPEYDIKKSQAPFAELPLGAQESKGEDSFQENMVSDLVTYMPPGFGSGLAEQPKYVGPDYLAQQQITFKPLRQLLIVNNRVHQQAVSATLIQQLSSENRPFFYATQASDFDRLKRRLALSAPLAHETAPAHITAVGQASGEFAQFSNCVKTEGPAPVIVVDLAHFSAADMAKLNALWDDPAQYGLPKHTRFVWIGVEGQYYQGPDFVRRVTQQPNITDENRFNNQFRVLPANLLPHEKASVEEYKELVSHRDRVYIDLFGDKSFEQDALGQLGINEGHMAYSPLADGLWDRVLKAVEAQTPIDITFNNPPKDDPAFERFYQLLKHEGVLHHPLGHVVTLPVGSTVNCAHEAMLTPALCNGHTFTIENQGASQAFSHVINESTFTTLFTQVKGEADMTVMSGLLAQHQGQPLTLYIAGYLKTAEWARLLKGARQHSVSLNIVAHPGVRLPEVLKQNSIRKAVSQPVAARHAAHVRVGVTPNPYDELGADLMGKTFLLDGLTPSDLVEAFFAEPTEDQPLAGRFVLGPLAQAIKNREPIRLVGTPTGEMSDYLQALLVSGQFECVSEPEPLRLESPIYIDTVDLPWLKALPSTYVKFTSIVATRCEEHKEVSQEAKSLEPTKAWPKEAKAFEDQRVNAVKTAFQDKPVVVLEGETGVGKTSFIQSKAFELCFDKSVVRYPGTREGVKAWLKAAHDDPDSEHVLMIEEGNMAHHPWLQQLLTLLHQGLDTFVLPAEGMQPVETIDLRPLKNQQNLKAILSANPLQYGAGRTQTPLLQQAAVVEQPPLPFDYIRQYILEPNLNDTLTEPQWQALEAFYEAGIQQSQPSQGLCVTPRDLAEIVNLYQVNPKEGAFEMVLQHFQQSLLPDTFSLFSSRGGLELQHDDHCAIETVQGYRLVPSRQPAFELLNRFLQLHTQETMLEEAQKPASSIGTPRAGLSSFVLEGSAGMGKTSLVKATLAEQGYQAILEKDFMQKAQETFSGKHYLYLSPGTDPEVREAIFEKALQTGTVVWCDEFNSQYFDEKQMNHYLDKGLRLIITQNPASDDAYEGRQAFSPAMQRRLLNLSLPNYTEAEWRQVSRPLQASVIQAHTSQVAQEALKNAAMGGAMASL